MNMLGVKQRGFSLIEFSVAVIIVSILVAVTVVSFGGARASGRDATRQGDLKQISTSMELHFNENTGYVKSSDMPSSIGNFIDVVPQDPLGVSYGWVDNSISGANDDQSYCAFAILEKSPENPGNTMYFLAGPGGVIERELSSDFSFTLSDCK